MSSSRALASWKSPWSFALRGSVLLMFMLLASWAIVPATAWAEESELEVQVETCVDTVNECERDKDSDGLLEGLKEVVALYEQTPEGREGRTMRKELVHSAGDLCRYRDDVVKKAAMDALGAMADENGARYLNAWLRPVDDDEPDRAALARTATNAAAKIADDGHVGRLLKMVEKSDDLSVAASAMRALGAFGDCKRYRDQIIEDLVKTVQKDIPGKPRPGQQTQSGDYLPPVNGTSGNTRWGTLSEALPEALNELTGQKYMSAQDWFDIYADNKRDLDRLFVNRG